MSSPSTVVIAGASVAGVRTAQGLRAEGFSGRLIMVGEESDLPYDKPPLSKQFLADNVDGADIRLLTVETAGALSIELRLGVAAARLDVADKKLYLADGAILDWDVVVLATGAMARTSPWSAKSGVHVLRTIADAQALRAELNRDQPVVVVGGGFIGAEVAAAARACGRQVTVVDPLPAPIGRIVGREIGETFTALHQRHGVTTEFGVGVESISGQAGDLTVTLTDGRKLRAGAAIVGIGATSNDGWLSDSDLQVDNGVICDEYCRAVNTEDVYAVGDVARCFRPTSHEHVRVEHWTNAVDSAAIAAHNIVHPNDLRPHTAVEYVWSDQYDWKIQIVGRPSVATNHKVVGTFTGGAARGAAIYSDDTGRLRGAVTVNWPKALITCRRLIAAEGIFDEAWNHLNNLINQTAKH